MLQFHVITRHYEEPLAGACGYMVHAISLVDIANKTAISLPPSHDDPNTGDKEHYTSMQMEFKLELSNKVSAYAVFSEFHRHDFGSERLFLLSNDEPCLFSFPALGYGHNYNVYLVPWIASTNCFNLADRAFVR